MEQYRSFWTHILLPIPFWACCQFRGIRRESGTSVTQHPLVCYRGEFSALFPFLITDQQIYVLFQSVAFLWLIFLSSKSISCDYKQSRKSESEIPQVSYTFLIFSGNYDNFSYYGNYTALLQWHKYSETLWNETEKQSTVTIGTVQLLAKDTIFRICLCDLREFF